MDRRRVWGARALPPSPLLGASRTGADGRREKMVNKYAAIVYIRLDASKKKFPIKRAKRMPLNF